VFRIIPHRLFSEPKASVAQVEQGPDTAIARLRVEGLLCSACADNVRRHIEAVEGAGSADVDLERGEARVTYDPARTTPETLARAVEEAVILRPARRLLGTLGRRFARKQH
jgi:copper chaperone